MDQTGRVSGLDAELATEIAHRWGVEVQFVNVHFDGLYDALEAGKFDLIISALPYDRMLTRDVLFPQSYFNAGQVLVAHADDLGVLSVEDLDGRRVAVELGAEGHQFAQRLVRDKGLSIDIEPVRETLEAFEALRDGQVDAIICDKVTALSYQGAGYPLRLVPPDLTNAPYVIAAPIEASETLEELDTLLSEWRGSGYLEYLTRRWFGGQ
jgi:ABC-type amino acid transport substrate-binding protein